MIGQEASHTTSRVESRQNSAAPRVKWYSGRDLNPHAREGTTT